MREDQQNKVKIKVGLTIFIGLIIFFIFILMIGTNDYLFSKTYNLYMYIDDATGLVKGAPVTLGGYKIGDVESVVFVPANNREAIRIKLRILKEYQTRITNSSRASISSIGILGDKFINITVGIPNETVLAENSTISAVAVLNLENIADKLTPGINNLNNILKNISLISDTVAAGKGSVGKLFMDNTMVSQIKETLGNIKSVTGAVKNEKGSLGKLIYNDELYAKLSAASENLNELTKKISTGKGSLGKLVSNDSLYNNINSTSSRLNYLLTEASKDSSVVNGLVSDKKLYRELMNSIINLNALVKDIKEHPEKYVKVSVF